MTRPPTTPLTSTNATAIPDTTLLESAGRAPITAAPLSRPSQVANKPMSARNAREPTTARLSPVNQHQQADQHANGSESDAYGNRRIASAQEPSNHFPVALHRPLHKPKRIAFEYGPGQLVVVSHFRKGLS